MSFDQMLGIQLIGIYPQIESVTDLPFSLVDSVESGKKREPVAMANLKDICVSQTEKASEY